MLEVKVERLGSITIMRLEGQLVVGETDILQRAVSSHIDTGAMVLDFARVNRIDARGLGVLLELREQARLKGMEFRLMNVSKLVQEILEITRLNTVFKITSIQSSATADQSNELEISVT